MLLTSCAQQDGRHPLYIKAQRKIQAGEYPEAEKLLLAYLKLNPASAKAHKDLATLYDDRLNAPLQALYHYRQYILCAPDAADAATVKKWMETTEHKYYLQLKDNFNDPEDIKSLRYRLEINTEQTRKIQDRLTQTEEQFNKQTDQYKDAMVKSNATADSFKNELQKQQKRQWEDAYIISKLKGQLADIKKKECDLIQENNQLKLERQDQAKEIAALKLELLERPPKSSPPPANQMAMPGGALTDNSATGIAAAQAAGQTPAVPAQSRNAATTIPETAATPPTSPITAIAADDTVSTATVTENTNPAEKQSEKNSGDTFYKIQSGDTLIGISKRFYGSGKHYQRIVDANQSVLKSPTSLKPGVVIEIPAAENFN